MAHAATRPESPPTPPPALMGLSFLVMLLLFGALLFLPAGRLDWPLGWIYLGIVAVNMGINWACLWRWNPELIERRMHFGEGTKTWDKVWGALIAPVMIAIFVVAGLEARADAAALPGAALTWAGWLLGLVIFVLGSGLFTWSMVVNPFFEKTVRIQTERGHRVIDTGPYAWVRHPGYVGFAGWLAGTPLLLGSVWALVPTGLALVGIVVRTALEDRTLQAELPGYPEYASRVRFRLIPGVW